MQEFVEERANRVLVRGNKDFVVVVETKTEIAIVDALVILLRGGTEVDRPTLAVDGNPPRLDLHGDVN